MALLHCHFFSETLGLSSSIYVILPQPAAGSQAKRLHPVLYLLHGLSDDHTIWLRRTSIERYAEEYDLAVVMPAVHRSFYTDMVAGYRYWSYVSDELPRIVRAFFPISEARDETFAAGLSMGGYGAFKLALRQPKRFAAAASLSGALDAARIATMDDEAWQVEMRAVSGRPETVEGSENDLFHLAEKVARSSGPKPRLYQWCGFGDDLYPDNVRFSDHARSLDLDLTYKESPGEHEWRYWDEQIQRVLEWLPLRRRSDDAGTAEDS